MFPGPLFYFDLITSARRARVFWIRSVYASALLFALWTVYPGLRTQAPAQLPTHVLAQQASSFFSAFSVLQLLLVLLVGPALVAPIISIERERRTIEYLFATDLTNLEIVFGKLLSRLAGLVYYVAVGLPILALTGLLGGVGPGELLMSFLVAGGTMASVAALSLLVSVSSRRVRNALSETYAILFAFLLAPWLLQSLLAVSGRGRWFGEYLIWALDANPIYVLSQILDIGRMGGSTWPLAFSLLKTQLIFSGLAVAVSVWGVRRIHLRASGQGEKKKGSLFPRRRLPVGERPMIWKETFANRFAAQGIISQLAIMLVSVVIVGAVGWAFFEMRRPNSYRSANQADDFLEFAAIVVTFLAAGAVLLIAGRAASCITAEREKDTWITLLSTPLPDRHIIRAKIYGNLYSARFTLWLYLAIEAFCLASTPGAVIGLVLSLGTILILTFFASALGTYRSLVSRNTVTAQASTLGILVFVGGGYLFCCAPIMIGGPGHFEAVWLAPCMPALTMLASMSTFLPAGNRDQDSMVATYVIGNLGYLLASFGLYHGAVRDFDRSNGRIEGIDAPAADGQAHASHGPPPAEPLG